MENAGEELKRRVAVFYPPAFDFQVEKVHAGVRMSPKEGVQPIVEEVEKKSWAFTGLGSKGMLYHALFAKELSERF